MQWNIRNKCKVHSEGSGAKSATIFILSIHSPRGQDKPGWDTLARGKSVPGDKIPGGVGQDNLLHRFMVYIINRYLRIDICIESNMSVSKKISITNVNGQTLYISTENQLANSEIAIILG